MKNKYFKVSISILIALLTFFVLIIPSYAGGDLLDPASIAVQDKGGVAANAQTIAGHVLSIVQVVGAAVAVIMLIVLATKYMLSAPNDKAEIKKHAVVYVVGAIILFGTSIILEIIKNFAIQIH